MVNWKACRSSDGLLFKVLFQSLPWGINERHKRAH